MGVGDGFTSLETGFGPLGPSTSFYAPGGAVEGLSEGVSRDVFLSGNLGGLRGGKLSLDKDSRSVDLTALG